MQLIKFYFLQKGLGNIKVIVLKNFIKVINLIILTALPIVFFSLYQKLGDNFYLEAASSTIWIIGIYVLVLIHPNIIELLSSLYKLIKNREKLEKKINNEDFLQKQWEEFIETNPIPTVIIDESNKITRKNHSFEAIEETYYDDDVLFIDELIDLDPEEIKKVNGFEKFSTYEVKMKNDSKIPFTIFSANFEQKKGKVKSWMIQFIDNSEKTELKEKFIQAQKMQAIGQLAGGIAHDFNNLLTAIIGFCDLMLTRHAPGNQDFVDVMQIKQNANRAANLVRQLLAFSRKQTMQMEVVDLNEIISEISNLLRRLISETINLDVTHCQDVWDIKADKFQLEQVLINLAVNARDAIKDSGTVSINTENIEVISMRDFKFKYPNFTGNKDIKSGKYVMISISDDGEGIEESNLKKIFEPFFTTKPLGEGTGLGLATVTGIIEQSGGYVYVSSELGSGTVFYILLKKYENAEGDLIEKKEEKEKPKDLTGEGTILIIEDEDPVRMFSSRALTNKGYKVIEAYSGDNALDVIAEHGVENIDLVISDVVMPGLSGPEVAEKITEMKPDIKLIFVSGYGEDAFYDKYGSERKFNFLPKPYSLNQLASKVKELI